MTAIQTGMDPVVRAVAAGLGGVAHDASSTADAAAAARQEARAVPGAVEPPPDLARPTGAAAGAHAGVTALRPGWFQDAIVYQVVPKSFKDSTGTGHGDIEGIRQNLDYIQSLGADTVWMTPHYPSPGADGGYDISDFTGVASQLGTREDMQRLGAEMERRGMHLVTELIMNHTSEQHPWFQQELQKLHDVHAAGGRDALRSLDPKALDYVWDFSPKDQPPTKWKDTRVIFNDSEPSNWTWNDQANGWYWHRFKKEQPDLNYENPAVLQRMLDVAKYHLDNGVHGVRLDALPYLLEEGATHDPAIPTTGENLQATHDIVHQMRTWVDTNYPGRVMVGESNMNVPETKRYFGTEAAPEVHAGFAFPQMTGRWNSVTLKDKRYLLDAIAQTKDVPEGATWVNFNRNHDELTYEKIPADMRQAFWDMHVNGKPEDGIVADPRAPINLGLRLRGRDALGGDQQSVDLLHAMMMAEPGTPVIYYGDEIGMRTHRLLEDRDGVRTPMQWHDGPNGGFSTAEPATVYRQLFSGTAPTSTHPSGVGVQALLTHEEAAATADAQLGVREINVAAQEHDPDSILNHTRATNQARRASPALSRGDFTPIATGHDAVAAWTRKHGDDEVLVVNNLAREQVTSSIDLSAMAGKRLVPYHSFEQLATLEQPPGELTMAPRSFRWYKVVPQDGTGASQAGA